MKLHDVKSQKKRTNREQYGSFSNYVRFSPQSFKILLICAMWGGALLVSGLTYLLYLGQSYEVMVFFGVLSFFGWFNVIRFYWRGGLKTLPDLNADDLTFAGVRKKMEEKGYGKR